MTSSQSNVVVLESGRVHVGPHLFGETLQSLATILKERGGKKTSANGPPKKKRRVEELSTEIKHFSGETVDMKEVARALNRDGAAIIDLRSFGLTEEEIAQHHTVVIHHLVDAVSAHSDVALTTTGEPDVNSLLFDAMCVEDIIPRRTCCVNHPLIMSAAHDITRLLPLKNLQQELLKALEYPVDTEICHTVADGVRLVPPLEHVPVLLKTGECLHKADVMEDAPLARIHHEGLRVQVGPWVEWRMAELHVQLTANPSALFPARVNGMRTQELLHAFFMHIFLTDCKGGPTAGGPGLKIGGHRDMLELVTVSEPHGQSSNDRGMTISAEPRLSCGCEKKPVQERTQGCLCELPRLIHTTLRQRLVYPTIPAGCVLLLHPFMPLIWSMTNSGERETMAISASCLPTCPRNDALANHA